MTPRARIASFALVFSAAILAGFAVWWLALRANHSTSGESALALPPTPFTPTKPDGGGDSTITPPRSRDRENALTEAIGNVLAKLQNASPAQSREILNALRAMLLGEDRALAARAITFFLASGKDAPTGLRFEVGEGGILSEADTLRVFLLDLLGQIDPEAAFRAATAVFAEKKSAEEWAVALRNAGWAGEQHRSFLAQKAVELLSYPPWQKESPPGFLEGFDAAVYAGATNAIALFGAWIEGDEDGANRSASLVAMNRFATLSPLAVAQFLNDHPETLAGRPFVRADYFTKADFHDERQVREVERYLDRADVALEEKRKMLAALEAPVFIVGDSLLTDVPPNPDLDRRELGIEARAKQWLASGRFPLLEAEIRALTELRQVP